jgi:hypothetical protein
LGKNSYLKGVSMTLSKLLLISTLLICGLSQAGITPDRGQGRDHYGPVRPGPTPGGYTESLDIYMNRYVRNETLNLFYLSSLNRYQGFRVQSVRVYIQRSREVNSSVQLLVNRFRDDERRADVGVVVLSPRSYLEIGRDLRDLDVFVRGEVLIERIVVDMVSEGGGYQPNPPNYGNDLVVQLPLPSYLPPQPRLNLTSYVDVNRYRGYRIKAVEITANARFNSAQLDIQLNGFTDGTVYLNNWTTTNSVYSRQNLVLGSTFGSFVLVPRGDSNITAVRLILSRY